MGKNQHVSPHPNGWKVQGEGNSKPSIVTPTKVQAVKAGTDIAKHQGSELIIHGTDGKIQNKNSFGNDPCPPKDIK